MSAWTTTYYVCGHHQDDEESLRMHGEMVLTRYEGGCALTVPVPDGPPQTLMLRGADCDLVVAVHDLLFYGIGRQGAVFPAGIESG